MSQKTEQTLAKLVEFKCLARCPWGYAIARAKVNRTGCAWEMMWEEIGTRVNKSAQAVWGRKVFYEELYRAGVSARQIGLLCGRPHSTVLIALREVKRELEEKNCGRGQEPQNEPEV